jgi:hypothetical protein
MPKSVPNTGSHSTKTLVHNDALCAGIRNCRSSIFCLMAAIVCVLLLLSKVAMNLKSLIKDDHWMRRVRALVDKVTFTKGMPRDGFVSDNIGDASMSNFAISHGFQAHNSKSKHHSLPLSHLDSQQGSGCIAAQQLQQASRSTHRPNTSRPLPPRAEWSHDPHEEDEMAHDSLELHIPEVAMTMTMDEVSNALDGSGGPRKSEGHTSLRGHAEGHTSRLDQCTSQLERHISFEAHTARLEAHPSRSDRHTFGSPHV